ncbi:nitroreductase/quinone reductase family protein [Cellulomonas fimi]|uniref:Nitroreductase family deazaflavin-dependent oxidoreductase n=1 Tax=Cellulomonas fimi TaxID=1708 RepID=A0A7Y0QH59_CELFI|nr:nitroreductase/quinone reductase family protein [Cellulomonas fimi]NMR19833.1 nitroreductase family deazaflavin-dependent oxidoreductase [Cellulomonas fimi]
MVDSRAARAAIRLHRAVLRLTGGRLGTRLAGLEQVLLTTTGRTTGRPRTTPLVAIPAGDGERIALIASNGGARRDPDWYRNLLAHPDVVVQRGTVRHPMRCRTAEGAERDTLWRVAVTAYGGYAAYQDRTDRLIPVVVCEPLVSNPQG